MTIPAKGSLGAKVGAKVGQFLSYEELAGMTAGVPNTEAYRLIAARVQHEIENMQQGTRDKSMWRRSGNIGGPTGVKAVNRNR